MQTPKKLPMIRRRQAIEWLLVAGWFLVMPPVPLGTSLPPVSAWSRLGEFDTSAHCESAKETMRTRASRMITNDPTADASSVAVAMGVLQTRCLEIKPAQPPAEAKPAPPPAPPAAKTDSTPPAATK
jgi:hypothetical protein